MAYPESVLADDEQVVEHLHPHWISLAPATLWFILICGLAGVGIAFAPDHGTGRTVVLGLIIVVGLVLLSVLTFKPWIQWRTTHYVITTHRVLIRRGVFTHTGRDISLSRISDVAFTQSLWDRIVGAGSVTIESAGEHGQETLTNIPRSVQQQQLLNRLIEQDEDRRNQPPPQAVPPQGHPQQGYPQQGYPQHGLPADGLPAGSASAGPASAGSAAPPADAAVPTAVAGGDYALRSRLQRDFASAAIESAARATAATSTSGTVERVLPDVTRATSAGPNTCHERATSAGATRTTSVTNA